MFNIFNFFKKTLIPDIVYQDTILNAQKTHEIVLDKSKIKTIAGKKIIQTARGEDEIQEAVDAGFNVLKYKVEPSDNIRITDIYILDKKTGHIEIDAYSYHSITYGSSKGKKIIQERTYYPYAFPPLAAYLLPEQLEVGERVVLEDLIEDIVGSSHAWGTYRQDSAEAIWNGEKFVVDLSSFRPKVTMG